MLRSIIIAVLTRFGGIYRINYLVLFALSIRSPVFPLPPPPPHLPRRNSRDKLLEQLAGSDVDSSAYRNVDIARIKQLP